MQSKLEKTLEKLLQCLIIALQPEKIILFGSRAKQLNRPFSDIDIAIINVKEKILIFANYFSNLWKGKLILIFMIH